MKLYLSLTAALRSRNDRGATAVEYGLMVTLIAVVIVTAVATFGLKVSDLFEIPAGAL